MDGMIDMATFLMKISVHVEKEILIEAEDEPSAQDIAQDIWLDTMGDCTFELTQKLD